MTQKNAIPVVEGLFEWPSTEPRLLASRCKKCGSLAFPKRPFCTNPDCETKRENIEVVKLDKKGTVYSFTYQIYQPPEPFKMDDFKPYAIGMVDFPEGLRIWGMFTRKENLKLGMAVETTVGKLYEDDKNEYITWMWKPID